MPTIDFAAVRRSACSAVGALMLTILFVGAATLPAQVATAAVLGL